MTTSEKNSGQPRRRRSGFALSSFLLVIALPIAFLALASPVVEAKKKNPAPAPAPGRYRG